MHKFTLTFIDNGELRTISGWADIIKADEGNVLVVQNFKHLRQVMTYFADTLHIESEALDKKPETC